jgi:hypothetical protein
MFKKFGGTDIGTVTQTEITLNTAEGVKDFVRGPQTGYSDLDQDVKKVVDIILENDNVAEELGQALLKVENEDVLITLVTDAIPMSPEINVEEAMNASVFFISVQETLNELKNDENCIING